MNELIDLLNEREVVMQTPTGNKTLKPMSMRDSEFVNGPGFKEKENELPEDPRVVVDFPETVPGRISLGDIVGYNEDNGAYIFGNEEITQVEILVSAKEVKKGITVLNARDVTFAIMQVVESVVKKKWNFTLKKYNASIDSRRAYVFRDLSKFLQADKRSDRILRLWIRHENTWDLTDEVTPSLAPLPTIMIQYRLEDDERYANVIKPAGD